MGVNWTDRQLQVIDTRNKEILVSAAAGSGKTAVLVERIIRRVTDVNNPMDIDRLVVVTFTEAAAGEMRERILAAITKEAKEHPENEHLINQLTYIHNAKITTIHSFCLGVIREHFNDIDIDPGFRIGDEGELKLLKADIINDMLEDYYAEGKAEFINFVESYSGGRSDEEIEKLLLSVYEFSRSYPFPEDYFKLCLDNYDINGIEDLGNAQWYKYLLELINLYLWDCEKELEDCLKLCMDEDGPTGYEKTIREEYELVKKAWSAKTYRDKADLIGDYKAERIGTCKKGSCDINKQEFVKNTRDRIKTRLQGLVSEFFAQNPDEIIEQTKETKKNMSILIELVKEFSDRFMQCKKEKNLIDFGDLEHMALAVLAKKDEFGKIIPTDAAMEISENYDEIMIDEYQDSNLVQETILRSISKEYEGNPNVFMVGDVKQSIYKFRLAKPELFMKKYKEYSKDGDGIQIRINLDKNFRSRRNIIDTTNYVFERIMTMHVGNILYDTDNALYYGADYKELPPGQDNKTELIMVETKSEDEEEVTFEKMELEAHVCANRIKEMINPDSGLKVIDKVTGEYRVATYRDIVILFRSHTVWGDVYERVLMSLGIPAYCEVSRGYFDTVEINTVLNLLSIINNPLSDIEFVSTLKAPFAGVTDTELAMIKSESKDDNKWFYDKVVFYAKNGCNDNLKMKLNKFLQLYVHLREKVPVTSIYELICYIVDATGYYNYVLAMPSGKKRAGNIDILKQKAIDYQGTSYVGLFNFIRYVEKLRKYDVDFGEAKTIGEMDDTVRIMSIHKSKGLEFPIVFIGGMAKKFNNMDSNGAVVAEADLGIGMDYRDPKTRVAGKTIVKSAIVKKIRMENIGEELRVLYVAMTRAKEKLIMIGTVGEANKLLDNKWNIEFEYNLPFSILGDSNNYLDWIGYCYKNSINPPIELKIVNVSDVVYETVREQAISEVNRESLINWDGNHVFDKQIRDQIKKQMEYRYPFEKDASIRIKVSVSDLKKAHMEETEPEEVVKKYNDVNKDIVPMFIKKTEEKITGARRGTIYHKVFELLNLNRILNSESSADVILSMVDDGIIGKDVMDVVDVSIIDAFTKSVLCQRMAAAEQTGQLYREKQFVMGVGADELDNSVSSDETVLVQGIIDVYFEEADGLVIADYKTDKVENMNELVEKYQLQLELYKRALEQMTGKTVKELIIYSTTLGDEISLIADFSTRLFVKEQHK